MKNTLVLLAFIMAGCQAAPQRVTAVVPAATPAAPAAAAPVSADATAALRLRLRALTADNGCSNDAQCLTVPVGARACGGPEAFLAYSIAGGVKQGAVEEAARRFSEARAQAVAASGELSTCIAITDPGALCLANTCQLRTRSNGLR